MIDYSYRDADLTWPQTCKLVVDWIDAHPIALMEELERDVPSDVALPLANALLGTQAMITDLSERARDRGSAEKLLAVGSALERTANGLVDSEEDLERMKQIIHASVRATYVRAHRRTRG